MKLFRALFIWWRDATLGTLVFTWLNGVLVGRDEDGNRYFRSKVGNRRWVVYRGTVDASRVPSSWHGWLHHLTDIVPSGQETNPSWLKDHQPNLSGTAGAYHPDGSLVTGGKAVAVGYEPWSPNA